MMKKQQRKLLHVWKTVAQLALKKQELPLWCWEVVLEDVLHSVRSLL